LDVHVFELFFSVKKQAHNILRKHNTAKVTTGKQLIYNTWKLSSQ